MKILVLGAGVVGTTAAYYLNRLGFEVTVLDRGAAPASETSFANGGQVSVSHAEPWANPGAPLKVLKWLAKEDAPLLFRVRADLRQWLWGLSFLAECTPAKTRHNIRQIVNLGTYSRGKLQELRRDTGIAYDERTRGILHFYTDPREFDACHEPARIMRELGCERRLITPDEAVRIEPALAHIKPKLAGATYTSADESGDAHRFTVELARIANDNGVKFRFKHDIKALRAAGGRVDHVEVTDSEGKFLQLRADAYVLALGSFSPVLAASAGVSLTIYPAKGYSVTLPVTNSRLAYETSLTDDEHKLVFSRLGERLRIAGTAELNGYDRSLNRVRCEAILRRVQELFPGASDPARAEFWAGLRPATPSNVPYIGKTRLSNLFLNTGHGTLGWTHACGSGAAIADIVAGRKPEVDFAFTGKIGVRPQSLKPNSGSDPNHAPAPRAAARRVPGGNQPASH